MPPALSVSSGDLVIRRGIRTKLLDNFLVSVILLNWDGFGLEVCVLAQNAFDLVLEVFQDRSGYPLANLFRASSDPGVCLGVLLDGEPSRGVDLSGGREDSFLRHGGVLAKWTVERLEIKCCAIVKSRALLMGRRVEASLYLKSGSSKQNPRCELLNPICE